MVARTHSGIGDGVRDIRLHPRETGNRKRQNHELNEQDDAQRSQRQPLTGLFPEDEHPISYWNFLHFEKI